MRTEYDIHERRPVRQSWETRLLTWIGLFVLCVVWWIGLLEIVLWVT